MAEYKSKTMIVNRSPMELYTIFTNLEGIRAALPADKAEMVEIDGDTVSIKYAGFTIAIRLSGKTPFSSVIFTDIDAPFHFGVNFHFDEAPLITQTNLWISVEAELNFMMKTMLGGKIQSALDQIVEAISTGKLPE